MSVKTEHLSHNDRMVNIGEVLMRLGVSRATLYLRIKRGFFPPSHNPVWRGRAQWPESVVSEWIAAAKRANQLPPRGSAE